MTENDYHPDRRSPAQKRLDDIENGQRQMNDLLETLPLTIKMGDAAVVSWLSEFAPLNVCPIIKTDKDAVLKELKEAGYGCRDGEKNEENATGSTKDFARHIIGQAIRSLEISGHLESPITELSAARFFKMVQEKGQGDWAHSVTEKPSGTKTQGRE